MATVRTCSGHDEVMTGRRNQADGGEFIVDQIVTEPAPLGDHFAHVDEDCRVVVERPGEIAEPAQ